MMLLFMSWLEVIVLAIVQGLTEFIPISSTAHLRIVPALMGWSDPGAAFTAVLQIGTLAAVLSYFWLDDCGRHDSDCDCGFTLRAPDRYDAAIDVCDRGDGGRCRCALGNCRMGA